MNYITISNLKASTTLGVYDFEKAIKTNIVLTINYKIDIEKAAKNDDISDAIDYHSLSNDILQWLDSKKTNLLETLANNLVEYIQQNYPITWIELSITKIAAINNNCNVTIKLEREFAAK